MLIIENLIPPEEKVKLQNRARYNEDEDQWELIPLANKRWVLPSTKMLMLHSNKMWVVPSCRIVAIQL